MAEHLTVDQVVEGSSPFAHPLEKPLNSAVFLLLQLMLKLDQNSDDMIFDGTGLYMNNS